MYNKYLNQLFCDVTELKKYVVKKLRIFFNADEIEDDTSSIIFIGDGVQSVQTTPDGDVTVTISGGENNVQADWEETNNVDPSFIQNKPTPTDLIFTGNVTTTQTGPNEITVDVGGSSSLYKVYTARLTQTGTTAPVATVFENTTSLNITYTYNSPGLYLINLPGVDLSKIWIVINNNNIFQTGNLALNTLDYQSGQVKIHSKRADTLNREDAYAVPNIIDIEIRIYN